MRLWQYTDGDELRYSLIPVLKNVVKSEESVNVFNAPPLTFVKVEETFEDQSENRESINVEGCTDSSAHSHMIITDDCVCNKCYIKFPMQSMLNRHKVTHNVRSWFLKRWSREKRARRLKMKNRCSEQLDVRGKRSEEAKYICTFCDLTCNRLAILNAHVKRKHGKGATSAKKLVCTICDYECSSEMNLNNHMSKHKNTTSFACSMCNFKCKRSTTLASHVTRNHKRSNESPSTPVAKRRRIRKCNDASSDKLSSRNNRETTKKTSLTPYKEPEITIKKEISVEVSHEDGIVADAPEKLDSQTDISERCDLCDFTCAKKSTLYSHKRRHKLVDVGEVYACNECGFKTSKKSSLYSHIKRKHKETRGACEIQPELFCCNQCDYKNKNKYELKIHVARKHSDDFKFSCETCGKKFKVKGDLTNHVRFSHREQPVICDVCGKTCLNSNSLYVHQKFAHYKAKYECQICKRRMVSQENLDEHMLRQHERRENVVCEECGKTFSRNSRLKVHMRIHTGDKPYTCTVCNKSFARRTALKQHLLIHTGMRPYVCDICGKAFTQKPGLISHRKSHPGSHPPLPRVLIDHILTDVMNA